MTRKNHGWLIILLLLPAVGYVAVFLSASLGMTVAQSIGFFAFTGETELGLHHWSATFTGQTLDSLLYSVRIAFVSAFCALLIAYPLALYLRGKFAGKKFLNAVLRLPLFVPALVAAFLILNVISYHGILNEALVRLGVIDEPLRLTHDDWGWGVVAIQVWKNLPFQTLILTAALRNVPADLESAARNLGAGRFAVFRHVLMPLSAPGIQIGATLVFIGVLGDYAINAVAGPLYPPSLSIRMVLLGKNFGEWGQAAVIAIVIILASLLFAWLFTLFAKLLVRVAR
ncbi:spermidine/putrescine ABC transporter permease [Acrocarpospora corrugata]|uniref:Spermidine/putrescine ABC transporter permease n=1 Tax=Acrocarpospora corrugata TaxID=35763 RepID=A0A5M3VZ58_9ACTN|nr:ABC transporter permease [Acrocarpospora corrugata]GES01714.1 spermidine/putrescine ABC transporter permease [Acrocarpospora corrugata]